MFSFVVSLYSFGAANGDQTLSSGMDANSGIIALVIPAVFYGASVKNVVVSTKYSIQPHCNFDNNNIIIIITVLHLC